MQVDMKEVEERLNTFIPSFIKYLIYEGDKIRKGDNANIAPQIRNIMKEYQKYEENSTEDSSATVPSHQFAAAILCIIIKLKESTKGLFIFFEVCTNSFLKVAYHYLVFACLSSGQLGMQKFTMY